MLNNLEKEVETRNEKRAKRRKVKVVLVQDELLSNESS